VTRLGYRLERVTQGEQRHPSAGAAMATPTYRRALWIVATLNLGYGIIEIGGELHQPSVSSTSSMR
jgi:Co/Zn/Cd efflux system component